MDMPTVTETTSPTRNAPAPSRERAADATRADRAQLTESVVHGGAVDRPDAPKGRDGAATHVHVHGGAGNRVLSKNAQTMLDNLDKHGDVRGPSEGKTGREGTSTAGITVVETKGAPVASGEPEKPAATTAAPTETPAASGEPATSEPAKEAAPEKPVEKPAEAAPAPDPKLTSEIERLQAHNRKLVSELEARSAPAAPDERTKSLDEIERSVIRDPIGALERLVTMAIGAKEAKDPAVQRFLSGAYGDWTEKELKVPMDRAARAEFHAERNGHVIDRDRRDGKAGEAIAAEKAKADRRNKEMQDLVTGLDRQLTERKHGEKFPLLMTLAPMLDGITPGSRVFTELSLGLAAGDPQVDDDALVHRYSEQLEKHLTTIDQKLRAHYAPKPATSTATPTPASEPSKEQAASAPAKADQAGARTITNASASVAPPTPPKEAAATTETDKKPPSFRNEAERRLWLARKHFEGVET